LEFDVFIGNNSVKVEFTQSRKLKHCYLKIIDENRLKVRANHYFGLSDAKEFINNKKNWILKQFDRIKANKSKLKDNEFLFLGNICSLNDFKLEKESLNYFYKEKAKEFIPPIVEIFSHQMNLYPSQLKFRKNKSRWGSCSFNNTINLNIYLMRLPSKLIEYVIVHELAHIRHKNHQKNFWVLVEQFIPDFKEREKELKSFF